MFNVTHRSKKNAQELLDSMKFDYELDVKQIVDDLAQMIQKEFAGIYIKYDDKLDLTFNNGKNLLLQYLKPIKAALYERL